MTLTADNEARAERGFRMLHLSEYDNDYNLSDPDDFEAVVIDAMTDLLHAGEEHGVDPEAAQRIAWRHYLDETTDARREREGVS